jgi:superoxide reductase
MKRRDMLKLSALGLLAATTPAMAKTEEKCNPYSKDYRDKIYNRNRYKKDDKNPTKGELKHTPEIKIGKKDAKGYTLVEITIGQEGIIHPSSKEHWIDFIELKADGKLVARTLFEPEASGYAAYKVKLDGVKTLTAVEGCNKHGIWEYTINL